MSITAGSITVSAIVGGFLFCTILYDTWQDTNTALNDIAVAFTLLLDVNFNKFCIKYSSGSFLFVNVLFQEAASVYRASYFRPLR
jgi:hypothetical protein